MIDGLNVSALLSAEPLIISWVLIDEVTATAFTISYSNTASLTPIPSLILLVMRQCTHWLV